MLQQKAVNQAHREMVLKKREEINERLLRQKMEALRKKDELAAVIYQMLFVHPSKIDV